MKDILQRLLDDNFSDLAGLIVQASIPVPEPLLNEIIEDALQKNKNITDCHVSIYSQNKISIELKTAVWPWPINLKLQIESPLDLSGSPRIRARLENHGILGKLGSILKAFPNGIHVQNDQVVIEIAGFLNTARQKELLELIRSMEVGTESGKLILNVRIEVAK